MRPNSRSKADNREHSDQLFPPLICCRLGTLQLAVDLQVPLGWPDHVPLGTFCAISNFLGDAVS
jgi:hypothetical protein